MSQFSLVQLDIYRWRRTLCKQSQQRRSTVLSIANTGRGASSRLKARNVTSDDRNDAGRLFHVVGPCIAKLRWPIDVRARGHALFSCQFMVSVFSRSLLRYVQLMA